MHLAVCLPQVDPTQIREPTRCPRRQGKRSCPGRHFKLHQVICRKPLRDTQYAQVVCQRYVCLTCAHAFRVYPRGVSNAHQSDTLKGLSVLLYILGLSYQGVADLLDSLGQPISKVTVYNNVQAVGERAQRLRRQSLAQSAGQVQVLGIDLTHVGCQREDTIVAVATAVLTGQPLTFEILRAETAVQIVPWVRTLARVLRAEVLVTDDADSLKLVADELGLPHQICRAHVNRNVHDLIGALGTKALEHPDRVPWELPQASVEQFLEDLDTLESVIQGLPADGQQQLSELAERYQGAPPPMQGQKATMWYRMRQLTLDWSENYSRLTLYQRWSSTKHQRLDGTNNATEQVIGQCVKERYRTMRGYKRHASILNVSSIIGWAKNEGARADLTQLISK